MASYDSNGNKKFGIGDAVMTRAGVAFSPDTGAVVGANVPRTASNKIVWNNWRPRLLYSHTIGETELNYADFLTALAAWEVLNVGADPTDYTKISLGNSTGALDMPAYRLGPIGRKHFVVTSVLHGDEHDGMRGLLNAMQLLRGDEFAFFRAEWTILWVPMMNPDGYSANTRNGINVGPNGQTVNLDANFDYYWTEYAEATTESKGTAPESEAEVTNLLNYWRFGNLGGPVQFGFVLDFHANTSPGARYQTRDLMLQKMSPVPISYVIPGSELEIDIDAQIWRMARTLQTLRARASIYYPNVKVRAVHTRSVPRMHAYFSSQGVPALAVEEVKVGTPTTCMETYQTASDFRLDYVQAAALALTSSLWESEDAILVEPSGTNILTNARFSSWSAGGVAPTGWTPDRVAVTREPFIKGQIETGDRFYPIGESVDLTPTVADALNVASEYTRAANPRLFQVAVLAPTDKSLTLLSLQGGAELSGTLVRNEVYGTGIIGTGVSQYIDLLGGGTAAPATGAATKVTRVQVDTGGIIGEANVGNLNAARMMHACCDNYWTAPSTFKGWVFGGFNAAGNRLTSIESWAPATTTATTMASVLPTALAGSVAVYYPPTDLIYVFGGSSAATTVDTIYEFDPVGDSIALHATSMTVGLKNAAGAYCPGNGKIYIIGGEVAAGTMSTKVYSFDPSTGVYAEETGIVTTIDNEDVEDGTTRPWATSIGRNCACLVLEDADDYGQIIMPGGRLTSGAGALTSSIYTFYPKDSILGLSSYVNAGKLMHDALLSDTSMTQFYSDAFADLLGWDNSAGAWTAAAGEAIGVPAIPAGWLICNTAATLVNLNTILSVKMVGAGALPLFKLAGRAVFAVGALTNGYYIEYQYDGTNAIWTLYRVVSGVASSLSSYVATASPTKQFSSLSFRTLQFNIEETSPVHLSVIFNGFTLIDYYDFSTDRITSAGSVGVFGGAT